MRAAGALGWAGLLFLAAASGAAGQVPAPEMPLVREVLELLEADRPAEAADRLEAAAGRQGPRRFAVWSLLGRAQLRLRQPEEAARSFEEALARAPGFLPARVGQAEAEIALGRLDRASADLESLVALPEPPPKALELLAGLRLHQGDVRAARELWRRLAELDGEPRAAALRGPESRSAELLLLATDRSSGGRDRLFLEVERDLSSAPAYLALGVERQLAGASASAAGLFRIALDVDEHDPIARLLLEGVAGATAPWPAPVERLRQRVAEIYADWEGRRPAAAAAAREILELRPRHAPLELIVARAAEEEGDHWSALEGYTSLLRRVGALPSLLAGAARAALGAGAQGAAECDAREALRLRPGDSGLLRLLAAARARAGALDEAIDLLRNAAAHAPSEAATWLQLGELLFEGMRTEEALEAYRRAIELDPGIAEEVRPFALAALVGRTDGGVGMELLARHAERHPESVDTLYTVGVARLRADDLAGAERIFRGLAEAAPGHSEVAYNLGQVYQRQGRFDEAREQMKLFGELKAAEEADWERHNQAHFRRLAARENETAGLPDEAIALYQTNAAEGTADADDYLAMARLLLAGGRAAAARAWLEPLLDAAPYDRGALELLASVDLALGRDADLERTRWKLEVLDRPCAREPGT